MSAHRPRKRFGQHFLRDAAVVRGIVAALAPLPSDFVVEIGPGEGVLTHELLQHVSPLHAVELDRDLVARLQVAFAAEQLILHQADALDYDFCALAPPGRKLRVIGNLPYNISTPLLFHLLERISCIADMTFMLQREVAARLAAAAGTKDYGRLSVMIQLELAVERLFDVPPQAFYPPPKVHSSVIRLLPHASPPVQVNDKEKFDRVVRAAFASRRKTLRNNLKGIIPDAMMQTLGIDPTRRAGTLTLTEFARLAEAVA